MSRGRGQQVDRQQVYQMDRSDVEVSLYDNATRILHTSTLMTFYTMLELATLSTIEREIFFYTYQYFIGEINT